MRILAALFVGLLLGSMSAGCSDRPAAQSNAASNTGDDFDIRVQEYLRLFPYQETFRYAMLQTGGDPTKLNTWVMAVPRLLKAGEDAVVRSNNDTLYKMAWLDLSAGPVVLGCESPSQERFTSIQLQDDRNANYRNIIQPSGSYTLYYGEEPDTVTGKAVQVPSLLSAVIVRIEVRDKNDQADMADALSVFGGVTIEGPAIQQIPSVDLLSGFDAAVVQEVERRMDETKRTVPYREMIVAPGQEPGRDVTYLNHATGTKVGWGGPALTHSAYESAYNDDTGETLDGSRGQYVLVTEEPPVKGFWSVTVYDSTTGRLHPNEHDRYHINNTTAAPNEDGTYTFRFKAVCVEADENCLEVPTGPFDVAARYYLPEPAITSGDWTMPLASLVEPE
jgi:hypothetical protein